MTMYWTQSLESNKQKQFWLSLNIRIMLQFYIFITFKPGISIWVSGEGAYSPEPGFVSLHLGSDT